MQFVALMTIWAVGWSAAMFVSALAEEFLKKKFPIVESIPSRIVQHVIALVIGLWFAYEVGGRVIDTPTYHLRFPSNAEDEAPLEESL